MCTCIHFKATKDHFKEFIFKLFQATYSFCIFCMFLCSMHQTFRVLQHNRVWRMWAHKAFIYTIEKIECIQRLEVGKIYIEALDIIRKNTFVFNTHEALFPKIAEKYYNRRGNRFIWQWIFEFSLIYCALDWLHFSGLMVRLCVLLNTADIGLHRFCSFAAAATAAVAMCAFWAWSLYTERAFRTLTMTLFVIVVAANLLLITLKKIMS